MLGMERTAPWAHKTFQSSTHSIWNGRGWCRPPGPTPKTNRQCCVDKEKEDMKMCDSAHQGWKRLDVGGGGGGDIDDNVGLCADDDRDDEWTSFMASRSADKPSMRCCRCCCRFLASVPFPREGQAKVRWTTKPTTVFDVFGDLASSLTIPSHSRQLHISPSIE